MTLIRSLNTRLVRGTCSLSFGYTDNENCGDTKIQRLWYPELFPFPCSSWGVEYDGSGCGLSAGMDKVYRDLILGHSLTGMDVHYMAPTEDTLKKEMERFTQWLDDRLAEALQMLTKPLTTGG